MKPKPVRVLSDPARTHLVICGVGGIGGYLLQSACRLLYGLREERRERREREAAAAQANGHFPNHGRREPPPPLIPEILLIDGDSVSGKNLRRQYFLPADVGKNKARILAERYGAAYGLEVAAYPHYLTPDTDLTRIVPEGSVVVGAVDNARSRELLGEKLSAYRDVVYLDSGNAGVPLDPPDREPTREERIQARDSGWEGQVLCGVRRDGETILPFPAEQMPDLVEDDSELLPSEVPCGQVVVSNPQRHLTNIVAATTLLTFLTPLLTEGSLVNRMSLFCARTGYVRSHPALDALDEVALA